MKSLTLCSITRLPTNSTVGARPHGFCQTTSANIRSGVMARKAPITASSTAPTTARKRRRRTEISQKARSVPAKTATEAPDQWNA